MSLITLEQAKKHLNIESDFTEDDTYIEELILLADEIVEKDIKKSLYDLENELGMTPQGLIHAAKLLVGTMYEHRESVIIGVAPHEMPMSYKYLVARYKSYTVG